jgi:putative colanic acid biosynthesis glycosyltransferase WcaI
MRILIHDFAGHPFQVDLSRELARRGHSVIHAYSPDVTTGRGRVTRSEGDPTGLAIRAVELGRQFSRYSLFRRPRDELAYGRRLGHHVDTFRPDVVLSANTPLLSQRRLRGRTRRHGAAFAYWLQDLLGVGTGAELGRRLGPIGRIPGGALERVERRLLVKSDVVVAISDDFLPLLREAGVHPDRVHVIENWAPIDELPERPRHNKWASRREWSDQFVFLYSGTLGLKHEPRLLLELAKRFRSDRRAAVVVISEGLGADWMRTQAREQALENLRVLDYQPYEQLPEVLATADVLVALLESSAGVFSVPSKVLSYLCAGRPLLASMPEENLAARTIKRAEAGIVTVSGDAAAFTESAELFLSNPNLRIEMGQAARSYAERTFRIDAIADRFENALTDAVARPAKA